MQEYVMHFLFSLVQSDLLVMPSIRSVLVNHSIERLGKISIMGSSFLFLFFHSVVIPLLLFWSLRGKR